MDSGATKESGVLNDLINDPEKSAGYILGRILLLWTKRLK